MKKIKLSLILACYNEGPTLATNLKKIKEVLDSTIYIWEIICIDDKSDDETYRILSSFAKGKKNVHIFKHETNIGRGGTVQDGIKIAKGDVVGFIDVDLEISPIYIPEFIRSVESGWDVVIATRIYKESLTSLFRWVLSKGYNQLTKYYLSLKFKDTEAGYKFFNQKKILGIVRETKDQGWFFDTEIVARSFYKKLKIKEIPVLFLRREDKQSTVRILHDTIAYLKAIVRFKKEIKK